MEKLKSIDYKILFELMKNSKISDRKLAKIIGVSQPTITRRRTRLENEIIDGYTAIPQWAKLGYRILAVTLVKAPLKFGSEKAVRDAIERSSKWLENQPNVIFGGECRGLGMTGIMLSIHKSYSDLDEFLASHRQQLGNLLEEVNTIIVNLAGKGVYRPLHFKYLAEAP
ncbi:MAG: Lrp/AsnC family transcriptional regulator [Candidatus Bathyarchaeota archaeon]|jgi:DNA-binding Lrp family transcriptional regulator|nr:MAG: Lrp/AsnC family transcriptional regulator [Candidatus Bathyarchaeota archaeon]